MPAAKLNIDGKELSSDLKKINRADIYGDSQIRVVDQNNEVLAKAGVSENGKDYLSRGDIKYAVTAGDEFTLKPVKVVNAMDGADAQAVPSSFTVTPNFRKVTADELALLEVATVYQLPGLQLEPGSMYLGSFNYRSSFEPKDAALVGRADGSYLLIGTKKKTSFVGMEIDSQLIAAEETTAEEAGGDADFGSLF